MNHHHGFVAVFAQNVAHLIYKTHKTGEYNMPVGIFQSLQGLEMEMQYFSDQRPDYYCFSNDTKQMTKTEIMVYFAGSP